MLEILMKFIENVGVPMAILSAVGYGTWRWGFDPKSGLFTKLLNAHLRLVSDTREAMASHGNILKSHTETDIVVQNSIANHLAQITVALQGMLGRALDPKFVNEAARKNRIIALRNGVEMCRAFKKLGVTDTESHLSWLQAQFDDMEIKAMVEIDDANKNEFNK